MVLYISCIKNLEGHSSPSSELTNLELGDFEFV